MKKLLSLFAGLFLVSTLSFAGNYTLNDEKIDNLFEQATEASIMELSSDVVSMAGNAAATTISSAVDTEVLVAFVLCWVVGGLGIHRVYMGGKPTLILIYFITCGGIFGIVTLIDWVMLLIKLVQGEGVGSYKNNDKFFGWQ